MEKNMLVDIFRPTQGQIVVSCRVYPTIMTLKHPRSHLHPHDQLQFISQIIPRSLGSFYHHFMWHLTAQMVPMIGAR